MRSSASSSGYEPRITRRSTLSELVETYPTATQSKSSPRSPNVSKRGRLVGLLLDPERYAELIDRLDYLEDSLAALQARDETEASVPWSEIRADKR